MIPKPIQQIGLSDLTALVGNAREGKTIEFKRELSTKDGDLAFLKGVSALANTAGGDFIIGMEATKDGIAQAVTGVAIPNVDAEKLRLEQLLATNIEPRLPRVDIHVVRSGDGRHIIVVRAAHSWIGPHRLTRDNKFYGRHSAGVYSLDVGELRTAFALGGMAAERIRAFRAERLAKITAGETPVPLSGASSVVLHMVPLPSFADNHLLDVVAAVSAGTHFPLPLSGMGGNQSAVNLDGMINYRASTRDSVDSYGQLFRDGAIEGVMAMQEDNGPYIVGSPFANMIVAAVKQYLAVQRSLEVAYPIFAMLSFCGSDGCWMKYTDSVGMGWYKSRALRGNVTTFPEIAFDGSTGDVATQLRPLMNIVWNAFGFAQSDMYNGTGGWKGTA